jgi:hypothetical protein
VENLLRCWVREAGLAAPGDGTLRVPLPASGATLLVPVHYWSRAGWHRFGLPRLAEAPEQSPTVDPVTLAALLAREAPKAQGAITSAPTRQATVRPGTQTLPGTYSTAGGPTEPAAEPGEPAPQDKRPADAAPPAASTREGIDLVARVADSVRRTADFISERRERPADGPDLFLSAEQALVLGHPMHPTPKSREGLSDAKHGGTHPRCAARSPCTGWLSLLPCSPPTPPGRSAAVPSQPTG